eukprot:GSChrysophyteH1.ASY1.ANO1.530.1 assembled CDS
MTHISAKYLYYASTVAVYIYTLNTFSLVNVVSVGDSTITTFSVSPGDENILIIGYVNGLVICYDISMQKVTNSTHGPVARSTVMLCTPHDPDICVIIDNRSNVLNRVVSWTYRNSNANTNAINNHKILEFKEGTQITVARWHPHVHSYLALGCNTGEVYLFNYSMSTKKIFCKSDGNQHSVVDIQWDRLSSVYLLVAYSNSVSMWDTETQSEINVFDKQPAGITSVSWMDWTAGNFITSNAKNGSLKVWNVSQKQTMEVIRVSDVGIRYIRLGPGTKQAVCAHVDGTISVFHLERKTLDFTTGYGHTETIFDCKISPLSPDSFLTGSYDGSVKMWKTSDLSLENTFYGADSIIYSVGWSPSSRLVGASTANGLVILWSSETGREVGRYQHHSKAIFSLTWNESDPNIMATSSADNVVVIFEANEDMLLQDTSAVPRGSNKGQQKKPRETKIMMKVSLSVGVFGINFCPFTGKHLIAGCQDGAIRMFDYVLRSPLVCIMRGHASRVFNVLFSPLVPGLIASGSDDKTVHVWRINMDDLRDSDTDSSSSQSQLVMTVTEKSVLHGHSMNVRAIQWNHEYSNILLSGSWDSSIRIWNTDTCECLLVVDGHAADVYQIVAHPARPLSYLSCSRDGTVRKWQMEGFVDLSLAQSVWYCSIKSNSETNYISDKKVYTLGGKQSELLHQKVTGTQTLKSWHARERTIDDRIDMAKKFYEMFNFYCGNNGSLDVWECTLSLLIAERNDSRPQQLPSAMLLREAKSMVILGRNEVVLNTESDARKLDTVKASARGEHMSEKTRAQLRTAAKMFVRVGNYQKYCDIMIELGQYQEALAIAPCVSYEYWRELSALYASEMCSKNNDICVPFFIGTGNESMAVDFYIRRNDLDGALITASKAESKSLISTVRSRTPPRTREVQVGSSRKSAFSTEINAATSSAMGLQEPKVLVSKVSCAASDSWVSKGQPILAAAQHLSIGNVTDAINLLISCAEYELALALIAVFHLPQHADCQKLLARRVAYQGDTSLAISIIGTLNKEDVEIEKALVINQLFNDETTCKERLSSNSLRSRSSWNNLASEMEMMGSDEQSIVPLIMSRQYSRATTLGLSCLRAFVRDPLELTKDAKKVFQALKFVKASTLEEKQRTNFLMYMLWFCSHEAAELGLYDAAASMLRKLSHHCGKYNFPIPPEEIGYQELFFDILGRECEGRVFEKLEALSKTKIEFKGLLDILRKATSNVNLATVEENTGTPASVEVRGLIYGPATNTIRDMVVRLGDSMSLPSLSKLQLVRKGCGSLPVVTGSLLPSATHFSHMSSCISGQLIMGPAIKVDSLADGTQEGYASTSELLGWARVNPFEPGLSGEWLAATAPPAFV